MPGLVDDLHSRSPRLLRSSCVKGHKQGQSTVAVVLPLSDLVKDKLVHSWVQLQLQNHPAKFWEDGIKDYITHVFEIMASFTSLYSIYAPFRNLLCTAKSMRRSAHCSTISLLNWEQQRRVICCFFLKKLEVQVNDLLYMFVVMPNFLGIWMYC